MEGQAFRAAGLPAALMVGAEDTKTISHPLWTMNSVASRKSSLVAEKSHVPRTSGLSHPAGSQLMILQ